MTRNLKFTALLCAVALSACGDDALRKLTAPPPAGSQVKFFNFGVNAPGVNFYANTTKMTAIGSATGTEATTGTTYGNSGAGGVYTAITPGQYDLSGKIAAATDKDLAISHVTTTLVDGKKYSFYQSGFYNTTAKTVDAFIVEDDLPPVSPDTALTFVRFVNAISNANPMQLFAKNTVSGVEVPIGALVAYKGAGAFVSLPGGVYDLSSRYAGTATNAMVRTGVSFNARSVYTITARGDITVTSTTATNRPQFDNTANR